MLATASADRQAPLQSDVKPVLLEVQSVSKSFDGVKAVNECSLSVQEGSITGLVGPNGAGKTTLLSLISGFESVDRGQIVFQGDEISRLPAYRIFHRGLMRTFQIPRPIPTMTVLENLVLAGKNQKGERVWNSWFRPGLVGKQENEIIDHALWVLEYVNLIHLRDDYASTLSGGQKKLLEFARTLMEEPKMVLLDEPGAGVNRTLMNSLSEKIEEQCYENGVTFLIIEHDMDIIARLCDPVICMSQGTTIFSGTFANMCEDADVLEAYLGSQHR